MEQQMSNRNALRGTGRTTAALKAAVDYARACAKFNEVPTAFLVVSNKEQWDYITNIAKRDLGLTGVNDRQRRLDFGAASIFVRTPEDTDRSMRGYRCPIILDHSVTEQLYERGEKYARDVALLYGLYSDRIVQ